MRLTLQMVTSAVAQTLNLNASQPKVTYYINRACEELLDMGRWVGTTIKYRICTPKGYITWPREIETIEAIRINGIPGQVENQWYQFLDYGANFRDEFYTAGGWANGYNAYRSWGTAIDEREAISYLDICPTGNPLRLKVYGTAQEVAGSRILLQFYDNLGNYVRTNDPKEGWVDGEFVAINSTNPQMTINPVSAWVGVQKPITNGVVRVTQYDTVTGLEILLASYEPSEVSPCYRRTYLPGQCCNGLIPTQRSVEIIGSQRFIPACSPRDYLAISSLSALVWKSKAVYAGENNNLQSSMAFDAKAESVLNNQLAKWSGSGTIQTPRINPARQCEIGLENFV